MDAEPENFANATAGMRLDTGAANTAQRTDEGSSISRNTHKRQSTFRKKTKATKMR